MIVNELKYPWLAAAAIAGGGRGGGLEGSGHRRHQPPPGLGGRVRNDDPAVLLEPPSLESLSWLSETFHDDVGPTVPIEWSAGGRDALASARAELRDHGAVAFPGFLTPAAVEEAVNEMRLCEDDAFTTRTTHNPYQTQPDPFKFATNSVYHHQTPTVVASTAYDELAENSVLKQLYTDPRLLAMVSSIVGNDENPTATTNQKLYLSEDPLGCCSVNVFRPGYFHGFHYDEAEFSVTLMLQDAEDPDSGLFQYTDPIRKKKDGDGSASSSSLTLELKDTADVFRDHEHDAHGSGEGTDGKPVVFAEHEPPEASSAASTTTATTSPIVRTLDFRPGTLLVLDGSRSLHRVTTVKGNRSRFVAVLTFATVPGFRNTPDVRKMFWGRTDAASAAKKGGVVGP